MLRRALALGFSLLLATGFAGRATAQSAEVGERAPTIGIGQRITLPSRIFQAERSLLVHLPPGYEGSDAHYPVLYLTDADTQFLSAVAVVDFLSQGGRMPPMIVIGVSTQNRSVDLTPGLTKPHPGDPNQARGGRADAFLGFMVDELIPWVDAHYRTEPFRILMGHSYGGLFCFYSLLRRPEAFSAYVAISPSLWWDDGELIRQASELAALPDHRYLYFSNTERERNVAPRVEALDRVLKEIQPEKLIWQRRLLPGENHETTPLKSLYGALDELIFAGWELPTPWLAPGSATRAQLTGPQASLHALEARYASLARKYGFTHPVKPPESIFFPWVYHLLKYGEVDVAMSVAQRAIELYPASPRPYLMLAKVRAQAGQAAAELQAYHQARERAARLGDRPFETSLMEIDRRIAALQTARLDDQATRAAALDRIFAPFAIDSAPGCSVGVFENGKTVIERSYGVADIATRAPLTGDTLFYMASISKQFTALSAVKLMEEGKLRMEDDIRRWLPELPDYGIPITVGMLMHHTSGIRDVLVLFSLAGTERYDQISAAEALRMLVRQTGLEFTPGSRYGYSNGGYFLLAQVVERASRMPFHEFARKRILEPLGMRRSYFRHGPNPPGSVVAHGYVRNEADGFEERDSYPAFSGSGGLMSSVNDMARYHHDFEIGHRVWTPRARELMLTPGRLSSGEPVDTGKGFDYAGGLQVGTLRGQPWIQHGGGHAAFRSFYAVQPQLHAAVVTICNRADDPPEAYVRRVVERFHGDALSGEWPRLAAPGQASGGAANDVPAVSVELAAALGAGTARYRSEELNAEYLFEFAGRSLTTRVFSDYADGAPLGSLSVESPEVLRSGPHRLQLARAADGSVSAFVLDGMRFTRVLRAPAS